MATKFYWNSDTVPFIPTSQGAWINTPSTYYLDDDSYGTITNFPYYQNGSFPIPTQKVALSFGVSRVLQPQTISGTVDLIVPVGQITGCHAFTRLHIYVVNVTANTVFATLLNQFEDTSAAEWPIMTPWKGVALSAPQTLTSCTIPSDGNIYRLVVEFGAKCGQTSGGYLNVQTVTGTKSRYNWSRIPDQVVGASNFGSDGAATITFSHNFLMVPLPVQPNKSIENAIDLGPLPINVTYNSLGPLVHWYKMSFTENINISFQACNTTVRQVQAEAYRGTLTTDLTYEDGSFKDPVNIPVKVGETLFIFTKTIQSPSGDPVTFDVIRAPQGPVQVGDVLVLSDNTEDNYYDPTMPGSSHAAWFNPVDGICRYSTDKMIASELGVSLANGRFGIADQDNNRLFIYEKAPGLNELRRVTLPPDPAFPSATIYPESMGTDLISFYIGSHDDLGTPVVFRINEDGTISPTIWYLPVGMNWGYTAGGGDPSFGVTRDGKILYWGDYFSHNCRRYDMITHTEILPAFTPPTGGPYNGGEVIVLKDNSIVCLFVDSNIPPPLHHKLVHYSPAGVILREIPYVNPNILHHICHNSADDMKVWVFLNISQGNRFQLIDLTDGSILRDFTVPYTDNPPAGSCVPVNRFDCSGSCPLMVMMAPVGPPDMSGIYFINPEKTHEYYNGGIELKIPNPTIKSTLLGE